MALVTASSLVLLGCSPQAAGGGGGGQTSMPDPTAPASASSPLVSSVPVETLRSSELSPVYWLGTNAGNVFLYREYREAENLGDPITTAVAALTRLQPLDPDYFNPLSPASKVGASITNGSVITLDISSDAFSRRVDAGIAERAVQQLVFTATAAAANAGLSTSDDPLEVVILVDGHHGYDAFGHVPLGQPMARNSSLAAPVWIIDPSDGATAAGRVEVFGRGVAYESELSWQIFRLAGSDDTSEGELVKDGTALVDADSGQIGEFRFSQKLDPGTYRLHVFQKDQDGRTDERQNADSKVFTIT